MSTNLTSGNRKTLQQWRVKIKGLLYQASRDGCSPAAFHQKCDNQGPTLTLLHNTSGYVFGGCTFQSWTSAGAYAIDPNAFLFRLKEKEATVPLHFPVKPGGGNAIYCPQNYGPTFGAGHDLLVFSGQTFNKVNNAHFPLNGTSSLGTSFTVTGHDAATFFGSTFNMLDIEVYAISEYRGPMENPWRSLPEESLEDLHKWVLDYQPVEEAKVKRTNILLLGPVGSGKSSFFNTINSIFRGYVTAQAGSGSAEHSLTSSYRMYRVREAESGQMLKFRMCDSMGMEEGLGLDVNDIAAILDGHVRDRYQFNPAAPITPETLGYRKSPTLEDRIHCVVFVMDSCSLDVFPEKILQRMQETRVLTNRRAIPQAVLLTKVDKLCALVEDNVADTFRSPAVQEAVDQAAKLVGLPRGYILPVKNYESEADLDSEINHLALTSLRTLLRFADDFLFNYLDSES